MDDEFPTLSSVVLTGDETVIHSARLKHNLDSLPAYLTEKQVEELLKEFKYLNLEDLRADTQAAHAENAGQSGEFVCESDLAVMINKIIEVHTSRMRAEISGLLEAHGVQLDDPAEQSSQAR